MTTMRRTAAALACAVAVACGGSVGTDGPAVLEAGMGGDDEAPAAERAEADVHAFETRTLEGEEVSLSKWQGDVTLIVNVASKCGLTPQYAKLQELHEAFEPRGFAVLGFPCNDFGGQEPGSAEEIRSFCTSNYGVSFPMFEKLQTKEGDGQSPLYARLKEMTGELPTWNFGKYLVSRDGKQVTYFSSRTAPDDPDLIAAIEAALGS